MTLTASLSGLETRCLVDAMLVRENLPKDIVSPWLFIAWDSVPLLPQLATAAAQQRTPVPVFLTGCCVMHIQSQYCLMQCCHHVLLRPCRANCWALQLCYWNAEVHCQHIHVVRILTLCYTQHGMCSQIKKWSSLLQFLLLY